MRVRRTEQFTRAYDAATPRIRRDFDKQIRLLLDHGPSYPSLDVHPWPAHGPDAKQARVNRAWRFYYFVEDDTYVIYRLQAHPKSTQRGR